MEQIRGLLTTNQLLLTLKRTFSHQDYFENRNLLLVNETVHMAFIDSIITLPIQRSQVLKWIFKVKNSSQ